MVYFKSQYCVDLKEMWKVKLTGLQSHLFLKIEIKNEMILNCQYGKFKLAIKVLVTKSSLKQKTVDCHF